LSCGSPPCPAPVPSACSCRTDMRPNVQRSFAARAEASRSPTRLGGPRDPKHRIDKPTAVSHIAAHPSGSVRTQRRGVLVLPVGSLVTSLSQLRAMWRQGRGTSPAGANPRGKRCRFPVSSICEYARIPRLRGRSPTLRSAPRPACTVTAPSRRPSLQPCPILPPARLKKR